LKIEASPGVRIALVTEFVAEAIAGALQRDAFRLLATADDAEAFDDEVVLILDVQPLTDDFEPMAAALATIRCSRSVRAIVVAHNPFVVAERDSVHAFITELHQAVASRGMQTPIVARAVQRRELQTNPEPHPSKPDIEAKTGNVALLRNLWENILEEAQRVSAGEHLCAEGHPPPEASGLVNLVLNPPRGVPNGPVEALLLLGDLTARRDVKHHRSILNRSPRYIENYWPVLCRELNLKVRSTSRDACAELADRYGAWLRSCARRRGLLP